MVSTVVIANLNSRKNRKDKGRIKQLRRIIGQEGEVFPTKSLDDLLKNGIPFIQKHKPVVVACDSGDGGLVPLVTALVKENGVPHQEGEKYFPYIAPTAGGTQNVFSKRCGLTSKPKVFKYLAEIVSTISKDQLFVENLDLMKIRDDRGLKMYGFTFGLGMPVTLLEEYYQKKDMRYLQIAWMAARCVGSFAWYSMKKAFRSIPNKEEFYYAKKVKSLKEKMKSFYEHMNFKYPLSINGEEPREFLAIMAQTIPSIGMKWSNLFYRAEKANRQFHIIGTNADMTDVLLDFPRIYLGRSPPTITGCLDKQSDDITIRSETSLPYQVNGELEYLGKKLEANEIKLNYGLTLNIVKTKSTP